MEYSIIEFGAKSDGSLCTDAIQKTIDACALTGGVVRIPMGVFLTGTLELKSNVTLYLEQNSVLKGSGCMDDYKSFSHIQNEWGEILSLIYAVDCQNIIIEGEGKIDFNGDAFFDYRTPRVSDLNLEALTEAQREEFVVNFEERPNQMIFFRKCSNIRIRNTSFYNAPCWGLVFSTCEQVKITGITIRFGRRIPNNDGIHLSSCKDAIVSGCDIVAGDDCIAVTGIDDWMVESRRILISDCILSSSSAGIRLGYFGSKVQDVQVQNCTVYNANRGICIMACKGGYVKNINISGLHVDTCSRIGGWWGMGEAIYISGLEHELHHNYREGYDEAVQKYNIENITVRDMTAHCENGIVIVGDQQNIFDIRFYNIRITLKDKPNRSFFENKMDFLPSKVVRMVPDGHLYWIFVLSAKCILVKDFVVECEVNTERLIVESCIEDSEDVLLKSIWE